MKQEAEQRVQLVQEIFNKLDEIQPKRIDVFKANTDCSSQYPDFKSFFYAVAPIDFLKELKITEADYKGKRGAKFRTFNSLRIGGGAAPLTIGASTLGIKNVHFCGTISDETLSLARRIAIENAAEFSSYGVSIPHHPNTTNEFTDTSSLGRHSPSPITQEHIDLIFDLLSTAADLRDIDWVTCSSFNLEVVTRLLKLKKNIYLDTGYDYTLSADKLLSKLCEEIRKINYSGKIFLAANNDEFFNMAKEFGFEVPVDLPFDIESIEDYIKTARRVSEHFKNRSNSDVTIVVHSSDYSFAVHSQDEFWRQPSCLIPTFKINPKFFTGAGDAFWNGFTLAYLATKNLHISVFFGNLVAAGRLTCSQVENPNVFPKRSDLLSLVRSTNMKTIYSNTDYIEEELDFDRSFKEKKGKTRKLLLLGYTDLHHILKIPSPRLARLQ